MWQSTIRADFIPKSRPPPATETHPLEVGQVVTIEPGYYKAGHFGIRIENVVEVVAVPNLPGFLGFRPITMAPIQVKEEQDFCHPTLSSRSSTP